MKSLLKFLMIIFIAGSIHASEDITKKIETRAAKADAEADSFTYHLKADDKENIVTSYFDMSKHASVVQQALQPTTSDRDKRCYDLRPLERVYCQAAYATLPVCKQHRGKLGFMLGAVSVLIPCALFHYYDNRV